jgi:hypothetical protein
MPHPSQLRPNVPFLQNYAVGFGVATGVADRLVPPMAVDEPIGVYNVFRKTENQTNPGADVRAPGSPTHEIDWSKSTARYAAVERGWRHLVTDEEADVMGRTAADQITMDLLNDVLNLGKELRVKAMVTTVANWGYTKVASGAGGWADAAADIVGDIRALKTQIRIRSGGLEMTTLYIPDDEIPNVLKNTVLKAADTGLLTAEMQANTQLPARLFGVEVVTPVIVQNTANIAVTPTYAQVWDATNVVVGMHVNPNAGIMRPTWALQFRVRGFGTQGQAVASWRDDFRKGDHLEIRRQQDERVTMIEAAAGLTGV